MHRKKEESKIKITKAEKFIRSATAPQIKAAVIMAKVNWKTTKTDSGIVPLNDSTPTSFRNRLEKPPTKLLKLPSEKERE